MAQIFIDQSGKVEQKEFDTVIAAVRDSESSTVILDRRLKREIFGSERGTKQQKVLDIFSALIFLAVLPILRKGDQIVIDREYPGQTETAAGRVETMLRHKFGNFEGSIEVGEIILPADFISKHPLSANFILKVDERNKYVIIRHLKK